MRGFRFALAILHYSCWLSVAAFLSNAASAEQISMKAVLPATQELRGIGRLAIRPFGGNAGFAFSRALQTTLTVPDSHGRPYFGLIVVGRGKPTGAEALIDGAASADTVDQAYQQQTSGCVAHRGLKCTQWSNETINCTSRTISVIFDVRIAEVSTHQIIYTAHKPARDQITWCEGQANSRTQQETIEALAAQAASEIQSEVMPHALPYPVRVMESTEGLSRDAIHIFKDLVRLSQNDPQDSCAGWQKLLIEEQKSGALAYDVGICSELEENYKDAENFYRVAQGLFRDGKKEIAASIERTGRLVVAKQQVEIQLMNREKDREAPTTGPRPAPSQRPKHPHRQRHP